MNHFKGALFEYPQAHPYMSLSLFLMHDPPQEIAVTSGKSDEEFDTMVRFLKQSTHPDRIYCFYNPTLTSTDTEKLPLLQGRIPENAEETRAYICTNLACEAPIHDAEQFILKLN
jgi:uncharacterized protein YyaL (SSP411 family)